MAKDVDILVAGGGIAGVFAAIGAKTRGTRVLIVEPHNLLGGQGTAGGVAGFCGDTSRVNAPFAELAASLEAKGWLAPLEPNRDRRAYDLEPFAFELQEYVLARKIDVLFHAYVVDAKCARGKVGSVTIATAAGLRTYTPDVVIDATGEATVARACGFPVFHEGPYVQLPMSMYFTLWDTGQPVKPYLPPNGITWKTDDDLPMTSLHFFPGGKVEVKMKVIGFDAADPDSMSAAEIEGRRQMMSLIYHLQTKGYQDRVLNQHTLASVSRQIGVREGRRIVGEHVLTEEEITKGRLFDDAVAVGTYHLDYHWPDRVQRAGTGITTMVDPYHIPLRSLIPKGAKNLLVPGRAVSGDQMAMSSYRVMADCARTGFAAGKAAAQCVRDRCDLHTIDVPKLQKTIQRGGQSLDLSDYGAYLMRRALTREHVFADDRPFKECHSSSLVQLSNNRFLVVWFAGTKEGHPDTGVWGSIRTASEWSPPRLLAKIGPVPHGNPVVFKPEKKGPVYLYFKAGDGGAVEWLTYVMTSRDEGETWSKPRLLVKDGGPSRGPVKNKPIVLSDGSWLAPSSTEAHEEHGWNVFVDRTTDKGRTWEAIPVPTDRTQITGLGCIQPTLWESEPGKVSMLTRSSCGWIGRSDSEDYGRTWSPIRPTDLPNPSSGIDLAKLDDGTLVLAYNPSSKPKTRSPLTLALSFDNGLTWPRKLDIDSGPKQYSYPAIIPVPCGVAVSYTWRRERIAFWKGGIEQIPEV